MTRAEYISILRTTAESITIVGGEATLVDVHGAKTKESLLPEFLAMQCFEVANVANPPSQQKGMSSNKPPANKDLGDYFAKALPPGINCEGIDTARAFMAYKDANGIV